jgi:hypothetical protein
MKLDKLTIMICALSIALGVSLINSYYVVDSLSQTNETEVALQEVLEEKGEPQDLPTGQESVPVITANNTDLAQVAPAEAVTSLLNWITISFIPAIIGLILAVTTLLKLLPMSKKTKAGIEKGEKALVYVDTLAPKVSKQFFANGASTNAIELILNQLDQVKPGSKAEIEKVMKYKAQELEAQGRESEEQIKQLKQKLTATEKADNIALPRISDGTVK